jgi:Glycosyl transferase family 2
VSKPTVICLTPIRNEAWILYRFLKCASLWADHIIIADQHSTDGSREIALKFPKVILVENSSVSYNELERQKLLIYEARKIPGKRLLISLDADEALTANFIYSPEWCTTINSLPGTVIKFQWVNIRPDFQTYWTSRDLPLGFMDDGNDHRGQSIHSPRIPISVSAPTIVLRDIKVLHYQYTDWERMQSKHRWYQCWERLNFPERRAIEIFRQYHHMYSIAESEIKPISLEWLDGYTKRGIDMTSIIHQEIFWWDQQVLDFFDKYGTKIFKREAVWDVDWQGIAQELERGAITSNYTDPRNKLDRLVHKWLKKTQAAPSISRTLVEKVLSVTGW